MLKALPLLLIGLAWVSSAQAQSIGSGIVTANATVPGECRVSATNLRFNNYDILGIYANGNGPTGNSTATIQCNFSTTVIMNIGGGQHQPSSACADNRRMKSENGDYLAYSIQRPGNIEANKWNSYMPGICAHNAAGVGVNVLLSTRVGVLFQTPIAITAKVVPLQYSAKPGNYTDSLTVYIHW